MVSPHGLHEERLVAVAIDRNKGSQYALKWATENVLAKGQKVTLLHVPQTTSAPQSPTSCHNGIGHDIAKSLIDYVSLYRVQNLILGCPSKNGISRLFTKSDVANTILKRAPSFCNVYVVSKGKISSSRMASHPLKQRFSIPSIQIPQQRNSNFDATNLMSSFSRLSPSTNKTSDDQSFSGTDRMSTDSMFQDCYDNLGCEVHPRRSSISLNLIDKKGGDSTSFIVPRLSGFSPTRLVDHLHSEQICEENSFSSDQLQSLDRCHGLAAEVQVPLQWYCHGSSST
ncbi:hypothetical protein HAX54_026654 [Datura stramonium]|uniref:RING-type E3 ubiquitin transferase n=1 Tax=Datura stramonium TaxID=4076 RepID=A0ABS8V1B3_DATST|nr:hypothetical protein [Datura stramonium]